MTLNNFLLVGFAICLCAFIFGRILKKRDKEWAAGWDSLTVGAFILGVFLFGLYCRINDIGQ